jgi:hypothetical protein
MSLSGLSCDSLEDFCAKSASCESSNHINSALFPFYVVFPGQENVVLLVDVRVFARPATLSLKCSVEVPLELVTHLLCLCKFLLHFCLFSIVGSHGHLALLDCLLPLVFLIGQSTL